jgi:hypothetical protein
MYENIIANKLIYGSLRMYSKIPNTRIIKSNLANCFVTKSYSKW